MTLRQSGPFIRDGSPGSRQGAIEFLAITSFCPTDSFEKRVAARLGGDASLHYLYVWCCMRILVIEDDPDIQNVLKWSLSDSGHSVDAVMDGDTGMAFLATSTYDALTIDLGLPDQDGLDVLHKIRQAGIKTPVLILSARASVQDRVRGLEQGADDYLTKPFAYAELLARLNNLVRNRSVRHAATKLAVLDLEMDLVRREVIRAGKTISVSSHEFRALELLCEKAGEVVTRAMILDRVWGLATEPRTNMLDVRMSRLRAKIDGPGDRPLIQTVRGVGYILRNEC